MEYHHKSGAQKRKERLARVEELRALNAQAKTATVSTPRQKSTPSTAESGSRPRPASEESEDDDVEETIHKPFFDIGLRKSGLYFTSKEVEEAVRLGPGPNPKKFPPDMDGINFPVIIFENRLNNNEIIPRDWLVWSAAKKALFCFPCCLFSKQIVEKRSVLATNVGWGTSKSYRKLYERIPIHENSFLHRTCYLNWKNFEADLKDRASIIPKKEIKRETQLWKHMLQRFVNVILFLAERELAFSGENNVLGDPNNGNFLGMLELISLYDPLLEEHMRKLNNKRKENEKVEFLSSEIQDELITRCAQNVRNFILKERALAKYFSIMVDATPDSVHLEQTAFILRYVVKDDDSNEYKIMERFLEFVDGNKTGDSFKNLILETLEKYDIPISACRSQSYDSGIKMSKVYKDVQERVLEINPQAIFSPWTLYNLNLCGVDAAESCPQMMNFFSIVQKLYNIFSGNQQSWEILMKNTKCSMQSVPNVHWAAKIECVKPFVKNLPEIKKSIAMILDLNLSSEMRMELDAVSVYLNSFECLLMATIWCKIITAINQRSTILQVQNTTIDMEVTNLSSLLTELKEMRNCWDVIINECRLVADILSVRVEFSVKRKKKHSSSASTEELFKINIFMELIESIISKFSSRFEAVKDIYDIFNVLWEFNDLSDEDIQKKAEKLQSQYSGDLGYQLSDEVMHLKSIYDTNFETEIISPIDLLNRIVQLNLESIYPNIIIGLRIFCTIPITKANDEKSSNCLPRIKNVLRSTMYQYQLSSFGLLAVEAKLAKTINYSNVIDVFVNQKLRRVSV